MEKNFNFASTEFFYSFLSLYFFICHLSLLCGFLIPLCFSDKILIHTALFKTRIIFIFSAGFIMLWGAIADRNLYYLFRNETATVFHIIFNLKYVMILGLFIAFLIILALIFRVYNKYEYKILILLTMFTIYLLYTLTILDFEGIPKQSILCLIGILISIILWNILLLKASKFYYSSFVFLLVHRLNFHCLNGLETVLFHNLIESIKQIQKIARGNTSLNINYDLLPQFSRNLTEHKNMISTDANVIEYKRIFEKGDPSYFFNTLNKDTISNQEQGIAMNIKPNIDTIIYDSTIRLKEIIQQLPIMRIYDNLIEKAYAFQMIVQQLPARPTNPAVQRIIDKYGRYTDIVEKVNELKRAVETVTRIVQSEEPAVQILRKINIKSIKILDSLKAVEILNKYLDEGIQEMMQPQTTMDVNGIFQMAL